MLRVIAADNHPAAIKGLGEIMREAFPGSTMHGASGGLDALARIEEGAYDLAFIDLALADPSGYEVLRRLKTKKPDLPVLVWTSQPEEQYSMRAVKAGGKGYLRRESTPEEVVEAARKMLSARPHLDPAAPGRTGFGLGPGQERSPHERLSRRETQVARMIGQGKTIREINEELGLSVNTIRTYRKRILTKIGVRGTNGLVHYVVKNGLIQ